VSWSAKDVKPVSTVRESAKQKDAVNKSILKIPG